MNEPKHRAEYRLTKRGKVVVWGLVLVVGYLIATADALWWTANPIPIH